MLYHFYHSINLFLAKSDAYFAWKTTSTISLNNPDFSSLFSSFFHDYFLFFFCGNNDEKSMYSFIFCILKVNFLYIPLSFLSFIRNTIERHFYARISIGNTSKMATLINIGNSEDPNYRYKMPKLIVHTEGRGNGIKTIIDNIVEVADALHRPPSYITKVFEISIPELLHSPSSILPSILFAHLLAF